MATSRQHPEDTPAATARRHELDHLLVRTQRDLQRRWELVMQPLGFRSTSLWVTFIGDDRRPTRLLLEVAVADDGADDVPGRDEVAHLDDVLDQVLREEGAGTTAALLIARPGRDGPTSLDRLFGRCLLEGARASGVPLEPLHVATDVAVMALAHDDPAA